MKTMDRAASCAADAWTFVRRTACSWCRSNRSNSPTRRWSTSASNVELYAVELDDVAAEELGVITGSAMLKDETKCIRCGLCAARCPVNVITMEAYHWVVKSPTGLIPPQSLYPRREAVGAGTMTAGEEMEQRRQRRSDAARVAHQNRTRLAGRGGLRRGRVRLSIPFAERAL